MPENKSAPQAARFQPGWLAWLHLNSIRGRYFYVAALFILFLLGASWFSESLFNDALRMGIANTTTRQQARGALYTLADDLWTAQHDLQGYLLIPNEAQRVRALKHLDHAMSVTDALAHNPWIGQTPAAREKLRYLSRRLGRLRQDTERVMALRVDVQKLFPAMPIMLSTMLPAFTKFYTAATLAMDAAAAHNDPVQIEVYRLFSSARQSETLMIGAFRVMVADRFGIFGDPESAMRAQAENIALYAAQTRDYLAKLARLDKRGKLGFEQETSLQQMQAQHALWLRTFKTVSAIYTSEHWRADIPLLRDTVQPLFEQSWETVRGLNRDVDAFSAEDMSRLTEIAERLSGSVWLLALIGLAVTGAGFLLFEFTVSRPIARVARALREHAQGLTKAPPPHTVTRETNDLVIAFEQMHNQVRSRQQRLETVLDNAAEGVITFDDKGVIESFNLSAEKLFGHAEREIIGKDIGLLLPVEHGDIQRLVGGEHEVNGCRKDGASFPAAVKISAITLEGRRLYTALIADISERKAMVEHLKDMAEHDGLTGLYNRGYFQRELERVVEHAKRRQNAHYALLYIDLDNFKYVNDRLGHDAGDRLLVEVAGILRDRARKSDLIARMGGDEFTVLLYDTPPESAVRIAESFRKNLAEHVFKQGGERIPIECSIGISAIGGDVGSVRTALSRADTACHAAKRSGRNQVSVFAPEDSGHGGAASLDVGWYRRIKEAVEGGRLVLAYQPIVNTRTRDIECYKALVRMRDEQDALIMPSGFLPAAQRFGLSADIDRWVITRAVETLQKRQQEHRQLRFSINLSDQTLMDSSVCDLIQGKLNAAGVEPGALAFEITETLAIDDLARVEAFLLRLRAMGCGITLDNFGMGVASFTYLKELPIDRVKIGGQYIKNMVSSAADRAVVRAVNDIAHALGKETIAEHVENEQVFRLVLEYGIDYAHGYYLGQPDAGLPSR